MPVLGPGSSPVTVGGISQALSPLVGDVILGARVRINDLPRTIPQPFIPITASIVTPIGATLPAGTYFLVMTFLNNWGETIATAELGGQVVAAGQGIMVNTPLPASWPPGATSVKVYYGLISGQENQWQQSSTVPFTISSLGYPGVPPTRNTTFYPDSDGQRVSAFTIYQWLNKALDMASVIANGIPDMTCLATVLNQTMYEVIGRWAYFDHGWWDGYEITLGGRDTLFYRNVVPGVVRVGVLQQISNRVIIELQPQPNYGGALTTAALPVGQYDTSITVASTGGFLLPFGLAVLGVQGSPPNPAACEVISFSTINGNVLGGVTRGMGGTVQQAWPPGAQVAEGNLRLSGRRSFVSPNLQPGNAQLTLSVPSGWQTALEDFIVARYRETEGNVQEANRLMQAFQQNIKMNMAGNKLVAGPRQIGLPGAGGMDTVPGLGGLGGGIILP